MTRIAMVALGKGLQTAVHDVRIFTHEDYEPLVAAPGLPFRLMRGNFLASIRPHRPSGLERRTAVTNNHHNKGGAHAHSHC
jgi:hypothetical protein